MKQYLLVLLLLTGCSSFSPVIVGPPDVKASVQAAVALTLTAQPSGTPIPTYTPFPTVTAMPTATPVQEPVTAPAPIATLAAQVARLEEHSTQQDTFLSYIATRVDALMPQRQTAVVEQILTPTSPPIPTPTVVNGWVTYLNETYKFSLQVPQAMFPPDVPGLAPYFVFGERITVLVTPEDPSKQLQPAQINERVDQATIAGLPASRLQGHISPGGGRIPQQFVQYVVQHGDMFYTFTVYALSVKQKSGAVNVIHALEPKDETLFEQIMHTVSFAD